MRLRLIDDQVIMPLLFLSASFPSQQQKKIRLLLNCKKCFQAQLAKLTDFLSPKEDFIE